MASPTFFPVPEAPMAGFTEYDAHDGLGLAELVRRKEVTPADLLDAAKHPKISFVSTQFNFTGDKLADVTGNLTLLGKTQPVTLKATNFNCYDSPMLKREVCGGDFETTIQRSQWGVNWGLQMGVADATKLIVQVEAVKQ